MTCRLCGDRLPVQRGLTAFIYVFFYLLKKERKKIKIRHTTSRCHLPSPQMPSTSKIGPARYMDSMQCVLFTAASMLCCKILTVKLSTVLDTRPTCTAWWLCSPLQSHVHIHPLLPLHPSISTSHHTHSTPTPCLTSPVPMHSQYLKATLWVPHSPKNHLCFTPTPLFVIF